MKKLTGALVLLLVVASAQAREYSFSPFGWLTDLDMYGLPARSDGITWNNLKFSPYVEVLFGYDSNPPLAHNWDGGSWDVTLTAGALLAYTSPSQRTNLSGNLFYSMDRYFQRSKDDRDTFGEQLTLSHVTPAGYYFTVSEGYVYGMGNDYYTGESADRNTLNLSVGAGRQSDQSRWIWGGTLGYEDTDYDNTYYNDNNAFTAGAYLGRHISEKSSATLSGNYSYRTSDNTSDIQGYNLMVGLRSRLSPKVTYSMEGGVQYSRATSGWDSWGASYNLSLGWKISSKLSASVYGSSWVQPSESANSAYGTQNYANLYNTIGAGVTFVPFRRLSTTTQVLYRRNEYKYMGDYYATGRMNGCVDDLYMARIAATLTMTSYLSFIASAQYQTVDSDLKSNEYNEYSAAIGLRLKY